MTCNNHNLSYTFDISINIQSGKSVIINLHTTCNMRRKRPVSTALTAAPEDGDGTGGGDGQEVNDNSDDNAGPSVAKKNNGRE